MLFPSPRHSSQFSSYSQAVTDIDFFVYTAHYSNSNHLVFDDTVLPPKPLLLQGLTKPIAFNSSKGAEMPSNIRSGTQNRVKEKIFKCAGDSLTVLCLLELAKGMSSGPSHCGGSGFKAHTHSSIEIFCSLKIPSSTLSQETAGHSNSFFVDHFLTNA